jgi:hypothetical protein
MTKPVKTQFAQFEEEIKKVKKSDLKDLKKKIEQELKNFWK